MFLAGDNAKAKQFFNLYANFRRKYIHLSHSPFNKTPGMSPGMVERDQKSKLVKQANGAGVAKGLSKIYGRDIFMNDDDSATQMIKSHNSFTCHLKFVSKANNDVTLPANVHI